MLLVNAVDMSTTIYHHMSEALSDHIQHLLLAITLDSLLPTPVDIGQTWKQMF